MKILAIFIKSIKEQVRQFWLVLLTILMAPFFVGIYYLMWESTQLSLNVAVVNHDIATEGISHGDSFYKWATDHQPDSIPIHFHTVNSTEAALKELENKKAETILIIPGSFSEKILELRSGSAVRVPFELSGDLSDPNYMLASIWAHEMIISYIQEAAGVELFYEFTETPAGLSGSLKEFDLYVPGLLILSIIMLMLTAAIAFVRESEHQTITRLKLAQVSQTKIITGITIVQVLIGLISILATLFLAGALGFDFKGSWGLFLLISILVCLSIIGFSLILAAITKTVNQILIVGNFPLFLFMFFTGVMMPIHGPTLFKMFGYDFTLPGLMSPYHAVHAIQKVSNYGAGFQDIWPELIALTGLTILYFLIGAVLFKEKHLKLK